MLAHKPKVVIADQNDDYALRLEDKFLRMMRDNIDLDVITDESYFQEFFSQPVHVDVAVISEAYDTSALTNQDIASLFMLSEEPVSRDEANARCMRVYKYTSLSHVFNQTMGAYSNLVQSMSSRQAPQFVLFFSPVGGSGKTTLAAGIATCLQELGSKVLYIDAEYQQGMDCLFSGIQDAPHSLAMALARGLSDPYPVVKEYVVHDVVDVVPPLASNIMSYGVPFDVYVALIEGAMRSGDYNYVVVDTDSVFNAEKLELVQVADALVVPVGQSPLAVRKTKGFLNSLDTSGRNKCHIIKNFTFGEVVRDASDFGGANQEIEGVLHHDSEIPNLFASDLAERDDIKAITYLVS